MATSGKISARNPLAQLSSDVWFAIITQNTTGNADFKVNIDVLKQYLVDTAKSAYDLWIEAGNVGTQEQFLVSLQGESAYDAAVASGEFTGTKEQWVACFSALYSVNSGISGQVLVAGTDRAIWRQLTKADVGLEQVDNTADLDKPVSNAVKAVLDGKVNVADLEPSIVTKLEALGLVEDENGDLILDEGRIAASAVVN